MTDTHTRRHERGRHPAWGLTCALLALAALWLSPLSRAEADSATPPEVEIIRKGLGKEVIVHQGPHEWYLLVEVTPDNTVIVRQHKKGETYLVDESETHDRSFTPQEVDGAVEAFVSSAKAQAAGMK